MMLTGSKIKFWNILRVVCITVFGVALLYVGWSNHQLANTTNKALCTFREDLQLRYDSGVSFLLHHPDGLPNSGISVADIAQNLHSQKSTLDSLSILNCHQ